MASHTDTDIAHALMDEIEKAVRYQVTYFGEFVLTVDGKKYSGLIDDGEHREGDPSDDFEREIWLLFTADKETFQRHDLPNYTMTINATERQTGVWEEIEVNVLTQSDDDMKSMGQLEDIEFVQ